MEVYYNVLQCPRRPLQQSVNASPPHAALVGSKERLHIGVSSLLAHRRTEDS